MNLREILANSFRFLGDLAGELSTGFRAVARVATEALDLLLQPLDLSGSLLDGARNRFVVGFVEREGAQQARQLNIIRADPGLVQVAKEFGPVLIREVSGEVLKQRLLGHWSVHGSLSDQGSWCLDGVFCSPQSPPRHQDTKNHSNHSVAAMPRLDSRRSRMIRRPPCGQREA